MRSPIRALRAQRYIFSELLPGLLLGITAFLLVLLMFQALRLTEFVLIHGVTVWGIAQIIAYLSLSFSPAILPMSLLLTVIITYGRLAADSELIAFKALGLHLGHLLVPGLVLGILVGIASARTSFDLAPWANRQYEVLFRKLGSLRATAEIRAGTFSEGFFDLVIYANRVDTNTGNLEDIFIYDERNHQNPLTIIAKKGAIHQNKDQAQMNAFLRLEDGSIHQTNKNQHTRVNFGTYDIFLTDTAQIREAKKSFSSYTYEDLKDIMRADGKTKDDRQMARIEIHKRMALAVACVLFTLLGMGLAANTQIRSGSSGGFVVSLALIVVYWLMFVGVDNLSKGEFKYAWIVWIPNFVFLVSGIWSIRRAW